MKKSNYSLRALQMAYLAVELEKQESNNSEPCMYCWSKECTCTNNSVQYDPFLNLNEEFQFA